METTQKEARVNIYRDGKLITTFTGEKCSSNAFGWMLRHQGNSVSWAIKYEGWKVEEIDEDGNTEFWKP